MNDDLTRTYFGDDEPAELDPVVVDAIMKWDDWPDKSPEGRKQFL